MSYEQSQFGDGSASGSGNVTTTVNNHYGPRESGGEVGLVKTEGKVKQASFEFTAAELASGATFPLLAPVLPAGALVTKAYVEVTEAFALGGTSPTIEIGTAGGEEANGVELTEAQAEATGLYDITATAAGTWAASLAAETTIDVELGGTSPTVGTAGRAEVVIEYVQ